MNGCRDRSFRWAKAVAEKAVEEAAKCFTVRPP